MQTGDILYKLYTWNNPLAITMICFCFPTYITIENLYDRSVIFQI